MSTPSSGWLIVGITGGTCSGKSTLAQKLADHLNNKQGTIIHNIEIGEVHVIRQDDYFYKRDSVEHTWIPGWNYINREILSALDMPRMCTDIESILAVEPSPSSSSSPPHPRKNVLLIEGFLIFNHRTVCEWCQLRFDVRITYEECQRRRATRRYNPPNPPGYFETFIWPFYQQHLKEYEEKLTLSSERGDGGLIVLDGLRSKEALLEEALRHFDWFCGGGARQELNGNNSGGSGETQATTLQ